MICVVEECSKHRNLQPEFKDWRKKYVKKHFFSELSHQDCHQRTQRSEFPFWRQQGEPTGERECPTA